MTTFQYIDEWLLLLINGQLSNGLFDVVAPLLREKLFWIPVYVFVITYGACNLSRSRFWLFLIALAMSVGLADSISSKLVKPLVGRERPCRAEALEGYLIERVICGSGASFTSSHAANHFAAAFVFICFLGPSSSYWKPASYTWAALVGWAQIYVGVHYPSDIVAGALLGVLVASVIVWCVNLFKRNR